MAAISNPLISSRLSPWLQLVTLWYPLGYLQDKGISNPLISSRLSPRQGNSYCKRYTSFGSPWQTTRCCSTSCKTTSQSDMPSVCVEVYLTVDVSYCTYAHICTHTYTYAHTYAYTHNTHIAHLRTHIHTWTPTCNCVGTSTSSWCPTIVMWLNRSVQSTLIPWWRSTSPTSRTTALSYSSWRSVLMMPWSDILCQSMVVQQWLCWVCSIESSWKTN